MMNAALELPMGRLALGTAQFGPAYGISNTRGMLSRSEACAILTDALEQGVRTIDTAEGYTGAEATIGSVLASSSVDVELVSKFPGGVTGRALATHLSGSLSRLGVEYLHGYLAHDWSSLLDPKVVDALHRARDGGLILGFGASVYYPREVEDLLGRGVDFDIVQLPYSIVDQRFRPLLHELSERNVRVHARSVFLQGLLLMRPDRVPAALSTMVPTITALRSEAAELGVPLQTLLLAAPLCQQSVDRVVLGVTSIEELRMNVSALEVETMAKVPPARAEAFVISDERLILPTHWPKDVSDAL
jgi:aryl-alcohol dehydrogenase-like predicted oxidoreductase